MRPETGAETMETPSQSWSWAVSASLAGVGLILGTVGGVWAASWQITDAIGDTRRELNEQIDTVSRRIDTVNQRIDTVSRDVAETKESVARIEGQLNGLPDAIAKALEGSRR